MKAGSKKKTNRLIKRIKRTYVAAKVRQASAHEAKVGHLRGSLGDYPDEII